MRIRIGLAVVASVFAGSVPAQQENSVPTVEKPAALVADGIPGVPKSLAASTRPYMEFRTAAFQSWNPIDRSMLITTRFGNTAQVHRVKMPNGARTQLSFEEDRVASVSWA
ncbi:MAG: S9 family peptidase, partial [Steroidobacteraceae bacterium]